MCAFSEALKTSSSLKQNQDARKQRFCTNMPHIHLQTSSSCSISVYAREVFLFSPLPNFALATLVRCVPMKGTVGWGRLVVARGGGG